MGKKIQNITTIALITLAPTLLLLAVLTIWEIMTLDVAKDMFLKIVYTYIAVFLVTILVSWIREMSGKK